VKIKSTRKEALTDNTGKKPKTVWYDSKYDASSNGIMLLPKNFRKGQYIQLPKINVCCQGHFRNYRKSTTL
jgi:dipeptidyl aminopeptidase/acylaminoacyl peptidase